MVAIIGIVVAPTALDPLVDKDLRMVIENQKNGAGGNNNRQ